MNKKELINELSTRTGYTKKVSSDLIDTFVDIVGDKLADGEEVKLVGFGDRKSVV